MLDTMIADSGYFSKTNVHACEQSKIVPYISPGRDRHNQPLMERFHEAPSISDNADSVIRMSDSLKTSTGRAIYVICKSTVEPVFGIIKAVMRFRQFLLRGFEAVQGEWDLVCIAWNLKRLHVLSRIV
jgi:hypothetical protein